MVSIAVKTFGVCDFSRLAVMDWRLRRWPLWFLALTATRLGFLWAQILFTVLITDVQMTSQGRLDLRKMSNFSNHPLRIPLSTGFLSILF